MSHEIIRPVREEDAENLLKVYAPYVENTAITFEWDVPSVEEFQQRIRTISRRYPYLVMEDDGEILGYAYAHEFVGRMAYDWSVETTIYMAPARRHQGLGKKMYFTMENVLKSMHVINLNACIGYPNGKDPHLDTNSADFHGHLGYHMVGQFHNCGYKFNTWYSMVWMEKMLGGHPDKPLPVISWKEIPAKELEKDGVTLL